MRSSRHQAMLAATALSLLASQELLAPLRSAGSGNNYKPTRQKLDTALQREIAEHNAAVDARKAAKRARKAAASDPQRGSEAQG